MKTLVYALVAILVIMAIKEVKTELQTKPSLEVMADSLIKHPEFIDSIKWYERENRNGNVSLIPYVDTIQVQNTHEIVLKIHHVAPHDLDTTKLFTNHSKIK